jgi:peptide/nickel transport system ATP-binding protein
LGFAKRPLKFISGSVEVDGIDVYKMGYKSRARKIWGHKIGMIPQYSMNSLNPVIKIKKTIVDFMRFKIPGISEKKALNLAVSRFEEIGLEKDVIDRYPFELSGGMKQRTVIIISALLDPKVLIADEITTALDVSTQRRLIEFLNDLIKKGVIPSLIFISHDIATLNQLCDIFYVMYAGKIVEYGRREDIIYNALHPYTKLLIKTIPDIDPEIRKEKLKDIPGFPPDLRNPPKGCRFYERCSYATDICKKDPTLLEHKKGRFVSCWLYQK